MKCVGVKCTHLYEGWSGVGGRGGEGVGWGGAFVGLSRDSEQRLLLPIEAMCAMYFTIYVPFASIYL